MNCARGTTGSIPYADPFQERIAERLIELVVLVDELRAEFHTEEASRMLWAEPYVERLCTEVEAVVRRLVQ